MTDLRATLEAELVDAERKAWDSLARWKFWMFGYWAAYAVKLKRQLGRGREPFFKPLVLLARRVMAERYKVAIGIDPDSYLIYSNLRAAWWRPDYSGYTSDLDQAGRYTREQAIGQCANGRDGYSAAGGPTEIPIRETDLVCAPGTLPSALVRQEDHDACTARDLSRRRAA